MCRIGLLTLAYNGKTMFSMGLKRDSLLVRTEPNLLFPKIYILSPNQRFGGGCKTRYR